ncbi:MAG: hypothetical protein WDO24_15725 [Pseudomonadota bacterium]
MFTTTKFHDQNPKTYAAVLAALEQAVAYIPANKQSAAEIYLTSMNDKKTPVAEIVEIMNKPEISFTATPQNVTKFAEFMYRTGRIKHEAKSWKDLFFRRSTTTRAAEGGGNAKPRLTPFRRGRA